MLPVTQSPPEFTTLRTETLEERLQKLQRFQLVMLEPKQISEFEKHFQGGVRFEYSHFLWQSWLHIKLATIVSEKEAVDACLQAKIPRNIPKRVTTRKVKQPIGPDRIDPSSSAYIEIFKKRQEEEKTNEDKKKENLRKKQEREIIKNLKKEKVEKKQVEKEKEEKGLVKKRGRPKKITNDDAPEESLEKIFSKKRKL